MRSLRALAQSALIVAAVVPNALHSQQFMNNLFLSTYEYSQNLKLAQWHDLWLYPIVNLYLCEVPTCRDMSTMQRSVEIISQTKPLDCINDISWFYAIMICIPVINAICYALLFHLVGGIIRLYVTRIKK